MVGVVIVSHSARIAEGVAELAREMGGAEVKLETAGGLEAVDGPDGPEHPIGTDAVLVMQAIERAWSDDGVLVLMDLGSAVLSAEMAVDLIGEERRERILLCEAPLVEGAVAAAVTAKLGMPLDAVATEARSGLAGKIAHLGTGTDEGAGRAEGGEPGSDGAAGAAPPEGPTVVAVFPVEVPHGLHARPAARFVQTAAGYEAVVTVRNLTTGAGPADASSLNAVATLGVRAGHDVEVRAEGPGATEAIAALEALAARRFDEPPEATGASNATTDEAHLQPVDAMESGAVEGTVVTGFAASPGVAVGELRRFHTPALDVPDTPGADPASELSALEAAVRETGGCDRRTARRGRRTSRRGRGAHLRRPPAVPARRGPARAGARGDRRSGTQRCSRVARRRRGRGCRLGRARRRVPARAGDRLAERRYAGAGAHPRPRRAGTAARRTRHPRRRRPDPRRHGGSRPGDGPWHRHRPRRPDVARRRARASPRYPGGRGRGTAGALAHGGIAARRRRRSWGSRRRPAARRRRDVRVRATGDGPHDWRGRW